MQLALRPYVTTGIALVGASVIAMSPISPVAPDVHVPSVNVSSAAVQLAAIANPAADPFTVWGEVLGSTVKNAVGMAGQVIGNGAPVLTQILANQVGYIQGIGTAVQKTIAGVETWASTTLPFWVQYASGQWQAGQYGDAMTSLIYGVAGVAFAFFPALDIFSIPGAIALNFGEALALLPRAVQMLGIGGLLGLIEGPALAFANQVQTLVNTASTGDLLGAVNTVLNTPAVMVDAFVNGFVFSGLLSPFVNELSTGLLGGLLVGIPKMIADAIRPPAPPVAPAAVESAPDTLAADISSTSISELGGAGAITVSLDSKVEAPKAPAAETPVEEAPVEEAPAAEIPVEETPVAETPIDETPVAETPIDETPVEETPVDDDTTDSGNGATDLSGGNKVTPGDTHSGPTNPGTGSEDPTEPTAPTETGASPTTGGASDDSSTDSGSDADNDSSDSSGGDE